jgi:hypothetical protein
VTTPGPYGGPPVPPMNAPPGAAPSVGVQPGTSPAVEFARIVVIYGTGEIGLFVYDGTPAAGNPPVAYIVPPGITSDLYGNALPVAGGIVSSDPGVSFAALFEGGIVMGLDGATASVLDATAGVVLLGAGQAFAASSGEAGTGTGSSLFLGDSASGSPGLTVISGNDGSTYDTERLSLFTAAPQLFDATSGVPVTGLSAPVAKGGTYRIRARIRFTTAAAGGNAEINFTGPATSLCELGGSWRVIGSSGSSLEQENTGLGGVFSSFGLNSGGQAFYLDGIVTFSAAGTLTMQGTCTSGADTWTTVAGCTMDLEPVLA